MPDQVSTLATALSASIDAGTVTPAQLTGLSSAIVSGAQTVAATRQSRRLGLLSALPVPLALPAGTTIAEVAGTWSEVQSARQFLAGAQSIDGSLNSLRAGGAGL
jgi:hypothetical protein